MCAYTPRGNIVDYRQYEAFSENYLTPNKVLYPYQYGSTCDQCVIFSTAEDSNFTIDSVDRFVAVVVVVGGSLEF